MADPRSVSDLPFHDCQGEQNHHIPLVLHEALCLLKHHLGRLTSAVEKFVCSSNGNNSLEIQGELFFRHIETDTDPLIAAVAATEAALLAFIGDRKAADREILWPQDPERVFAFLLQGHPFSGSECAHSVFSFCRCITARWAQLGAHRPLRQQRGRGKLTPCLPSAVRCATRIRRNHRLASIGINEGSTRSRASSRRTLPPGGTSLKPDCPRPAS